VNLESSGSPRLDPGPLSLEQRREGHARLTAYEASRKRAQRAFVDFDIPAYRDAINEVTVTERKLLSWLLQHSHQLIGDAALLRTIEEAMERGLEALAAVAASEAEQRFLEGSQ
jgi:hypothetical protein